MAKKREGRARDAGDRSPRDGGQAPGGPSRRDDAGDRSPRDQGGRRPRALLVALALAGASSIALVLLLVPSNPAEPARPRPSPVAAPSPRPSGRPTPRLNAPLPTPPMLPPERAPPTPSPVARVPGALEARFPRTVEGTTALAEAFGREPEAKGRIELLRELGLRVGAGWEAPVPVPAALADAAFRKALADPDRAVRLEAVAMLSMPSFAAGGPLLEAALPEATDAEVRRAIVAGLPANEGPRAIPLLVQQLSRESPADQVNVVEAIARAGGPDAIAALERIAGSDAGEDVRSRAAGLAKRLRMPPPPGHP